MDAVEINQADLWATGLSPDSYPTEFVRAELTAAGVVTAAGLIDVPAGSRVTVAGVVTHRQRPATAQGVTFHQSGGRDGPDQRDLLGRGVDPLPPGGPLQPGPGHRRAPGAGGDGHQRGGRTHPSAVPAARHRLRSRDFRYIRWPDL